MIERLDTHAAPSLFDYSFAKPINRAPHGPDATTRASPTNQQGFSMLELMISLVLFSLVATSLTSAFIHLMQTNTRAEIHGGAVLAAQKVLDNLRLIDPGSMPESGLADPVSVEIGERVYSVEVEYCPTGTEYCSSSGVRHIRAVTSLGDTELYTVETVYAQLQ